MASAGSKRPAPTSSTDAAPAAAARRSASSAGWPSSTDADPLREERIAGADDGDGLEPRRDRAVAADLALLARQREAAVLERDVDVAGPELGDRVERHQEVVVVEELLADQLLRLVLVRRHEPRLRLEAEPQRLALGVEHDADAAPPELASRVGVERLGDTARQRAGEHDELGAARQVAELVHQRLELALGDLRAPTR